ncbi:hypothetical protein BH20VER2_BH20VER2_02150 [soil metagenome]
MIEAAASKSCGGEVVARPRTAGVLTWLNLVCLDAPLVAVSWCWLFAQSFDVPVTAGAGAALFLTAWLIYLADRLSDSLSLDRDGETSLRQRFCLQHRRAWIAAGLLLAILDLVVIATLDSRAFFAGAAVGAVAGTYLLINHTAQLVWRAVPLKEVTIGFVFAAGTMVPLTNRLTSGLLIAWLLFGCLCSLNCIFIAVWERELDMAQRRVSVATAFPALSRSLWPMLIVLGGASLAAAFITTRGATVDGGVALSAVLLGAVHKMGHQVQPDVRTALADLALLAPAVLLLLVGTELFAFG